MMKIMYILIAMVVATYMGVNIGQNLSNYKFKMYVCFTMCTFSLR